MAEERGFDFTEQRNTTDVYDIAEITHRLEPVFRQYGVREAVLFGSYAKGEARPASDVDLLVDSGLRGLDFFGLGYAVTQALQKEVDLFDVDHIICNSHIDHEIKTTGVHLYGSKTVYYS